VLFWVLALLAGVAGQSADLPRGQVIDEVSCLRDPAQSYALYVPSAYTPDRAWPVIYVFDPGARGRVAVELFHAAAEQYGYIVAGSNNSRNGRPNADALVTMPADVSARFHVDARRLYTAGMSGGSRVALGTAEDGKGSFAGVFAASAAFPDAVPRKAVPFAIFSTAGTEDFNHLELRLLDRALTTPHRLEVFTGGHGWPPESYFADGIEWFETQAMKSGIKARDAKEIDALLARRLQAAALNADGTPAAGAQSAFEQYVALRDIAADFKGLRDTTALARRAATLARDPAVVGAIKRDRDEDDRENAIVTTVTAEEKNLDSPTRHTAAMVALSNKWEELSAAASAPEDSADRRIARRAMAWLAINTQTMDDEYVELVREIRNRPRPR